MKISYRQATEVAWARYANLMFVALFWSDLKMPIDRRPIGLISLAVVCLNAVTHLYMRLTGDHRSVIYIMLVVDPLSVLGAVYFSDYVASPFLLVLLVTLYSFYFTSYDLRQTIRYGLGCLAAFVALFVVWWLRIGDIPAWKPHDYPVFTFAVFSIQVIGIGGFLYLTMRLPSPLLEELNRQEAVLVRQEQRAELGTSLAAISHEVRTPLSTVLGSLDQAEAEAPHVPAERRARFETAVRRGREEVDRINRMLSNVLAYARQRQGQYRMAPTLVRDLLDRATEFIRLKHGKHQRFAVEMGLAGAQTALVNCDQDAIFQVLVNVMDNAVRARDPGRSLVIEARARAADGELRLAIRDNGRGIDPTVLPHLFEKFYTGREDGTGLGLYVSRQIVEDHGGTIRATARDGAGTEFEITLPLLNPGGRPAG